MKATATLCSEAPVLTRARALDYLALTKPRVAVLVLFTVAVGSVLASGPGFSLMLVLHTVFGTALVAGGASALNQLIERNSDARMKRTANRPLPAGRLLPIEVFLFGITLGIAGTGYLAWTLQQIWTPLIAAATFFSYVCLYTPLKAITPLNTIVGAVPGAMPPIIGWTAARGGLDWQAGTLFLIIFVWQIPHFLAIAWIYRRDYSQAGLKMLPGTDPSGSKTGWCMVLFAVALIPVGLIPAIMGNVGRIYQTGSVLLGMGFLLSTIGFLRQPGEDQARRALRASLIYLPGLLALLVLEELSRPGF